MCLSLTSVCIQEMQPFSDHLVVYERENGLPKISIYCLPPIGEPLDTLRGGRTVNFIDPVYSVDSSESQFYSSILRFFYSSMRTPSSVYDYDMNSGTLVLKKIDAVFGGFDSANYITQRVWATATDGTQTPISVVYRKDLVKLDGSDPLILYGYGSYEICVDPYFKESRLSLLDRGFIFAVAHIRGGVKWGDHGNKYCSTEKLCIERRSAGGLLIGAVINMRPDLFKAAVAGVPLVDVLTTMLDPTIPLTTSEWEEWSDPRKEEFYFYMRSYSPVDNIHGSYSEAAKFVAKLREMKTDDNMNLVPDIFQNLDGKNVKSFECFPKICIFLYLSTILFFLKN
ncbi:prolyl oligopeptidase family protein [Striga asiatica]|uniref:Prolyl endopeptidase n=1 Tax=Striga asiatica TaxID=4170 RepID=A0A5A7Q2W0_STRAF|nr:prolyl oligopeptidase family protein [Striga asiatica]